MSRLQPFHLSDVIRMTILVSILPAVFWIWGVGPIGPCRR